MEQLCNCSRNGVLVPGIGPSKNMQVLMLGDTANSEECLFKRAFASRDGDLIKRYLDKAKIEQNLVGYYKAVNCFSETKINKACIKHHEMQLHILINDLKPKVIISFGPLSYRMLTFANKTNPISDMIGKMFNYKSSLYECKAFCWYNPQSLLNMGKKYDVQSINFLKMVKNVI